MGTTERYKKNAIDKLSTLVGSYDSAHITGDKSQVEILNFNYTDLKNVSLRCLDGFNVQNGEKLVSENHDLTYYKKINVENIHGEIDKQNIIFGIDSHDDQKLQNHDFQLLVQPFTKTSRKLRMTESTDFSIRSSYHNIVFFGHSLSDADYSYFEYIFDEVNLYSSNCNLIFKYATAYDSDNAHAIKASVCENVEKLIRRYQDTLPENQQKDLFNRLLIQHRIQIIDIDETKNYEK
ncbi:AbiH family protein [Fructobacillus papyrifericola]|uniref:Uncharacterized protein n=1 Tax=Fructobacillus papyrifericola TaxID=2713172 RepID=A0ABS5QUI7_9LACO|nr:hypothetical protein [Fructobacillus papyrifericola]